MAAKPTPYGRHANGRDYVCALDGAVLPDGVIVQGHYNGTVLDGVRAIRLGTGATLVVAHACGVTTGLTDTASASGKWIGQA